MNNNMTFDMTGFPVGDYEVQLVGYNTMRDFCHELIGYCNINEQEIPVKINFFASEKVNRADFVAPYIVATGALFAGVRSIEDGSFDKFLQAQKPTVTVHVVERELQNGAVMKNVRI